MHLRRFAPRTRRLAPSHLAEKDDRELDLDLAALLEGHDLKELVHGSDASRRNDEGHGLQDHPKFSSEEVVVLEGELGSDVGIEGGLKG